MKIKTFSIFIFSLLLLSSCGDSDVIYEIVGPGSGDGGDPDTGNPIETNAQMEADIDGVHFEAMQGTVIGNYATQNINGFSFNIMQIIGANEDKTVTLQFSANNLYEGAVITFEEDGLQMARVSSMSISNPGMTYDSVDFTGENVDNTVITITDFDPNTLMMSGTFTATVYNPIDGSSKEITNGIFTDVAADIVTDSSISYDGYMNLTMDNIDYTLNSSMEETLSAATLMSFSGPGENSITLSGMYAESPEALRTWVMSFPGDIAVGTYTFDGFEYLAAYVYGSSAGSENYEDILSGTLEITEHASGSISGTFEFSVESQTGNEAVITNGEFSFNY